MPAYYNEIDAYAAQWLRNLIGAGHIAPGDVDERDIREVSADDLVGYQQVHLFAGIGGWSLALRLAGWPNDEPVFTGSCPCQPLSSAGQRKGHADERHLWPAFYCLIAERRPATVFGEQVASKDGREWLAGVRADLEHLGYACGAADLPAASVGAPHIRQRLWWVANANGGRREGAQVPVRQSRQNETSAIERGAGSGLANDQRQRPRAGEPVAGAHGGILGHTITPHERDGGGVADAECSKRGKVDRARRVEGGDGLPQRQEGSDWARGGGGVGDADCPRHALGARVGGDDGAPSDPARGQAVVKASPWGERDFIPCADRKARRIEPSIQPLVHGVPGRVGRLRAYGNAIVPQVAAAFIEAARDVT